MVLMNDIVTQTPALSNNKNLAIFVDVSNLYFCINKRWPGRKLDFAKFVESLKGSDRLLRATAYGTEISNEASGFKKYLRNCGLDSKYKKCRFIENGEAYRSDWSIGITLDIVRLAERVDSIILCTSNPEFSSLVEWVREKGVRCVIHACGIPRYLRRAADDVIEIGEDLLLVENNREENTEP